MKHFELELEHQYKSKFLGRRRVAARKKLLVVGSSREADIRLLGDDVSAVHAYIQNNDGVWSISDAGSERGTWLDKKPIVAHAINEATAVTIGGHTLRLTPHAIEKSLFTKEKMAPANGSSKGELFHQVIIRKHGHTHSTELLSPDETFEFIAEGQVRKLVPPKAGEVVRSDIGHFEIVQRMVKGETLNSYGESFGSMIRNPEMRAPLLAAILFFLGMALVIIAIPKHPNQELTELKPDNKYNRMVFDAELMKKKREQAKEIRKTLMAKSPQPQQQSAPAAQMPSPQKSAAPATKVVKNLKMEQLSSLLGKITKRANTKGPMMVAFGGAPESSKGHASTVAATGSLQGVATNVGVGGNTFKVGAIGTSGVGGGKGVAGTAGLANGAVGSGTVGILDEETEIEGGLDKEVIARVIAGYLGEIRFCYERQLSAEPDIYGKVQLKFSIDAAGMVANQRVGLSSLKSAMVEGCILRRVARWKFPLPKGGTEVLVTYPFMFKATN